MGRKTLRQCRGGQVLLSSESVHFVQFVDFRSLSLFFNSSNEPDFLPRVLPFRGAGSLSSAA